MRGPLIGLLLLALDARAGGEITSVRPAFLSMAPKPGATQRSTLEVSNASSATLEFEIQVNDWYRENGVDRLGLVGTLGTRTAGPWLKVLPRRLTVPPAGTGRVDVTMSVPRDARGGYYAAVTITSVPTGVRGPARKVTVVSRVGIMVPILVAVGGGAHLDIRDVRCAQRNSTLSCEITVRNKGDVHTVAGGSVLMMDKSGGIAANMEIAPRTWLPDEERTVEAIWLSPVAGGTYETIATLKTVPSGAGGAVASRAIEVAAPVEP